MKKIILVLFAIFFPISSFAVTLGSSVGINFGGLRLKTEEKDIFKKFHSDSNLDIGLFYKYNWNIKRAVVGVEFFYDYLNLENFFGNASINFKHRYGINLNLGYDVSKNLSVYGIVGCGLIKYKAIDEGPNYYDKENNSKFRPLYGFGIGYAISTSWKVNLEYDIQTLKLDLYDGISNYKFKNSLESLKFSIIYKF